jgi:hypothetical protein
MTSPHLPKKVEHWPLQRLRQYDRNSRTHTEDQIDQVAASILEFGFTNPLLVDEEGVLIAGHCRLAAATKLGLPKAPVIVLSHLTAAQRRAYVIADNQLALRAGWDTTMLAAELDELQLDGFEMQLLGFDAEELNGLLNGETVEDETEEDPDDRERLTPLSVPEHLPSRNALDVPDLLDDNQPTELPKRYVKWGQIGREQAFDGLIHFYTDDYKFKGLWERPWLIPQAKAPQAVEPNYSTFGKDPAPYHVLSTFYKRWLARYWQDHGVQVWVDLNVIGRSWTDYLFLGVPDTYLSYATRYQRADLSGEKCGVPHLEETYERIVQHVAPSLRDQIRFLVYGGGSAIRDLCTNRGWLYLQDSNRIAVAERNQKAAMLEAAE